MTAPDPAAIQIAQRTHRGMLRDSNQDACGHAKLSGGALVLCVADGMGGHAGGETASRLAVETVTGGRAQTSPDAARALEELFRAANRRILEEAQAHAELAGMGTTAVGLLFVDGAVYVANVGDSRAYRLRDGRLVQLTRDHSLVAELVRRGVLTEAQARAHPRRNELLRSLGLELDVEIDVERFEVRAGDRFVLCTDGLCGVLDDDEILRLLESSEPEQAAARLVDAANQRGGPDNVTVQVAAVPAA